MRGNGRIFARDRSPFWWVSYCRNGKEIRESTAIENTERNRNKAARFLKQRLGEIAAETYGGRPFIGPAQQRVTVASLLEALEQDYRVRDKCTPQFLAHLRPIREAFGSWRAVNVTAEAVNKYINDCKEQGLAPATINRSTQLIVQAFKLAIEQKRLATAPMVQHLPERNARQGFFEHADFEAVAGFLPDVLQDFARFGYLTGWRKGEISSLQWSDVDPSEIRLRPENSKNGQGRSVPLRDAEGELTEVGQVIERRRAAGLLQSADNEARFAHYVFHRAGLRIGDIRKAWASACKRAGLQGKLFHDLRRTAVRNMVRAGVPERVAMEISGHKTRSIFDRYNIVSDRDKQDAMRKTQTHLASMPRERKVAVMPKAVGR